MAPGGPSTRAGVLWALGADAARAATLDGVQGAVVLEEETMATERLSMLRQKWQLGRTHRDVASSVGASAGAVGGTVERAKLAGLYKAEAIRRRGP